MDTKILENHIQSIIYNKRKTIDKYKGTKLSMQIQIEINTLNNVLTVLDSIKEYENTIKKLKEKNKELHIEVVNLQTAMKYNINLEEEQTYNGPTMESLLQQLKKKSQK